MSNKELVLVLLEVIVLAIILLGPFSPVTVAMAVMFQMIFWVLLVKWQK